MKTKKGLGWLLFAYVLCLPQKAMSLGGRGETQNENPSTAAALASLFFGASLICSGVMIIRNKKYGPEEGLRGNYIKGEHAVFWGILQTFFGALLCCLGVRELLRALIS